MKEKLLKIIQNLMEEEGLEIIQINPDSRLLEDLNFDSMILAVLTVIIEEEFQVDIFENSFPKTFGDILDILENK